jgi:hypothetical protein
LKNSSFFVRLDVERTHINQKIGIFENPTSACQTTVQRPLFFDYCIAKNQNKPVKKQSFENVNNQAIFTMDCDCPS